MLADTAVLTLTNNGLKKAVLLLLNSETFGMLSGNGEAGFSAGTSTTIGSANESGAFSGTTFQTPSQQQSPFFPTLIS